MPEVSRVLQEIAPMVDEVRSPRVAARSALWVARGACGCISRSALWVAARSALSVARSALWVGCG